MSELALDTDVPAWVDPVTVLADVLDILRLPASDADAARIEALIPTAAHLVDGFLDRGDDPLPVAPPMHPLVRTGMTNVTVELYRRKDAPFGVLNSWTPDGMATRISSDPLASSRKLLQPLKRHWGLG